MKQVGNNEDYFNIGSWLKEKLNYHKIADHNKIKRKQVNQKEVWKCDFGYNVGQEKNKNRPVIILSNNQTNRTGKVLVAPITEAFGKINSSNLPQQNTWYLLYSDTANPKNMFNQNRQVPQNAITYDWIYKDSIIQCEEMQSVSKARLSKSKIGLLHTDDWERLTSKIKNAFDIK